MEERRRLSASSAVARIGRRWIVLANRNGICFPSILRNFINWDEARWFKELGSEEITSTKNRIGRLYEKSDIVIQQEFQRETSNVEETLKKN